MRLQSYSKRECEEMRTKEENSGMKSNFLHIFARLVYDPKTHLSCIFCLAHILLSPCLTLVMWLYLVFMNSFSQYPFHVLLSYPSTLAG